MKSSPNVDVKFNGKMCRMLDSYSRREKKINTTTHRHRDERLNSNLTKWLNAKVAPIFALRLRITAFLTFFCLFSFRIYLCCHVFFSLSARFGRANLVVVFFFLHIIIPFIVLLVTSEQHKKNTTERKMSTSYYIENNITLHLVNMYRR